MSNGTLRVRHIGTHERRADTMTGTGTVWNGYGDVQTVPAKDWEVLQKHPDLWELVNDEAPTASVQKPAPDGAGLASVSTPTTTTNAAPLADMDRDALYALAMEQGKKPHAKLGKTKLLELLGA